MGERRALGKRLRFEVFKRDGFRCVYCGATPVQTPLHIDHVIPIAEDGTNDPANLVTACDTCNLGKGPVPLERKKLVPAIATEAQLDQLDQIKEYLRIQSEVTAARAEVAEQVATYWEAKIGPMSQDMFDRLGSLLQEWPIERLMKAIDIVARQEFAEMAVLRHTKYFHGILRRWREEDDNG